MEPEDRALLAAPHNLPTGDFSLYPIEHHLIEAEVAGQKVTLRWSDSRVSEFHALWLRDNCPCCVHHYTLEQTYEVSQAPVDLHPATVGLNKEGALVVEWAPEEHRSVFHPGWLRAYCSSAQSQADRWVSPTVWDGSTRQRPDGFAGDAVCADQSVELAWLKTIRDDACALLHGVPATTEAVGQVADRIGVVRHTNFGGLFDVKVEADPVSNSNTGIGLPPHTDLPTREYQPGLQLLHCLVNSVAGGFSFLVDGFRVAEEIRQVDPRAFTLLTTVPWDFANRSRTSDYRWRAPMIGLDADGHLFEVRAGSWLRGPLIAPFDLVEEMYAAYQLFEKISHSERFQIHFRLEPGDCLIFDNRRALHARTAFEAGSGHRHLRGCYLDRDELRSSIRLLERHEKQEQVFSSFESKKKAPRV